MEMANTLKAQMKEREERNLENNQMSLEELKINERLMDGALNILSTF